MANTTIKYKQLYDEGEPFYPVVGKSSYNQWIGYEEVDGTPPDENFVTPIENGGTGADNASDARTNLGLNFICDRILDLKNVPTTETAYSCNWQNYDVLIVCATFWNHILATDVVPQAIYFSGTAQNQSVQVTGGYTYYVYQNGNGSVKLYTTGTHANYGVRIYGIKLG